MSVIDLRSDTVTRPTEEMLEAMRHAELGDDGREGDPTVAKLEAMSAERTGKDAGLFVVSGTAANLIALLAHTGRGGEVVLEANSHILRSEMGGIAGLAGLYHRPVPGQRGAMDLETVRELVTPTLAPNRLATALLCMETTHNDASGAVLPLDHMAAIHALGRENGVPVHTDGARLFNAAVKLGVPAARIAAHTDSVTFCISKGLSAPVGSVITGSRDFITKARAYRRMIGGNLRQGGVIAAAGIVALETMVDRLAEDHDTAKRLAEGLHRLDAGLADAARTETNIVQVETKASGRTAADWVADLKGKGVLAGAWSKWVLRLVTHRHIGDGDVERTLAVFAELWRR
ncbi:MAG: DegT/DnrJ/EryC1/StrS family aminotransferase [Alphaproteobacteria bacterium]|nr:DegT/DnrJ/EryC1/StrS family aminotransferase [Alphaproteobacteria bacterium]